MSIESRRRILHLGGLSLASLAGCVSSSGGDGGSGSGRQQIVSGTYDVNEDEWKAWTLTLDEQAKLEYTFNVRDGPSVDVFLMDDGEYTHYSNGESFNYYSNGSAFDAVSTSVEVTIPQAKYAIVIDNTAAGQARPPTDFEDNVARVEFEAYLS